MLTSNHLFEGITHVMALMQVGKSLHHLHRPFAELFLTQL